MRPEDYIKKMELIKANLEMCLDDINRSVSRMQECINTNDKYFLQRSKLAAFTASDYTKLAASDIYDLAISNIELR